MTSAVTCLPTVMLALCPESRVRHIRSLLDSFPANLIIVDGLEGLVAACQDQVPDCVIVDLSEEPLKTDEVMGIIQQRFSPRRFLLIAMISTWEDTNTLDPSLFPSAADEWLAIHPHWEYAKSRLTRAIQGCLAQRAYEDQQALDTFLSGTLAIMSQSLDQSEVFGALLHQVTHVVAHDAANVCMIEGDHVVLRYARGYSADTTAHILGMCYPLAQRPIMFNSMKTGSPYMVNDIYADPNWNRMWSIPEAVNGQACLCTPIKAHGQVIGFINLDRFEGRQFSNHDVERMAVVADQAAVAIINSALFETIARDTQKLRQLQQAVSLLFNTRLLNSTNLAGVGAQIAEMVVSQFNAVDCGVIFADWEAGRLVRFARAGAYQVQPTLELSLHAAGLVPEAVRVGQIVYAPDVSLDPRYLASEPRTRSELVIPLRTQSGVVGVLDLQSVELSPFNEQDILTLSAFADYAAVVISNILLVNEMRVHERANAILKYSSDAIFLIHPVKGIQQVNPAFEELFGYSLDALEGALADRIVADEFSDAFARAVHTVFSGNGTQRLEVTVRRADGGEFPADVMLSAMETDGGRITGVVCDVRDITLHKQLKLGLEEALAKERELVELKTLFLRHASHELRTPLAVINSSVDLLLMAGDRKNAEQRAERLHFIQSQVMLLSQSLNEMFELNSYLSSQQDQLSVTEVDFEHMVHEVVEAVERSFPRGHRFVIETSGNCESIKADRDKIGKMLRHLLVNAVKFSDPGTTVTVSLKCDASTMILVRDQGIGIPKEYQRHVYEPYFRVRTAEHDQYARNSAGLGLGLTIVKQVVELHGGQITIESEEGQGTTVAIVLPVR